MKLVKVKQKSPKLNFIQTGRERKIIYALQYRFYDTFSQNIQRYYVEIFYTELPDMWEVRVEVHSHP
jgi:hypothetical protein